jgi:hypothetical protein
MERIAQHLSNLKRNLQAGVFCRSIFEQMGEEERRVVIQLNIFSYLEETYKETCIRYLKLAVIQLSKSPRVKVV